MEEILEKRTSNIKVFKKDKGLLEARVYGSNVHYLKDGKYLDISNKLIEKEETLINEENSYRTIINKNNGTIRYEQDGNYLEIIPEIKESLKCEIAKNTKEICYLCRLFE